MKFSVEEIRNWLKDYDTVDGALFSLSEENILAANVHLHYLDELDPNIPNKRNKAHPTEVPIEEYLKRVGISITITKDDLNYPDFPNKD